jgi:hypothetical protein
MRREGRSMRREVLKQLESKPDPVAIRIHTRMLLGHLADPTYYRDLRHVNTQSPLRGDVTTSILPSRQRGQRVWE